MAKLEKWVHGDFQSILDKLHYGILEGSLSASFEDGSQISQGEFQMAVRVYERYSWSGGNRVSLTLTLAGSGGTYFLSAITAGGSQATFFKLNTWGEEAFLDTIAPLVEGL